MTRNNYDKYININNNSTIIFIKLSINKFMDECYFVAVCLWKHK